MVEAAPVPLARALGNEVGKIYAGIHSSKGVDGEDRDHGREVAHER